MPRLPQGTWWSNGVSRVFSRDPWTSLVSKGKHHWSWRPSLSSESGHISCSKFSVLERAKFCFIYPPPYHEKLLHTALVSFSWPQCAFPPRVLSLGWVSLRRQLLSAWGNIWFPRAKVISYICPGVYNYFLLAFRLPLFYSCWLKKKKTPRKKTQIMKVTLEYLESHCLV